MLPLLRRMMMTLEPAARVAVDPAALERLSVAFGVDDTLSCAPLTLARLLRARPKSGTVLILGLIHFSQLARSGFQPPPPLAPGVAPTGPTASDSQ